jgi:hypothetical protein
MFLVPADGGNGNAHADVHMTYAWLKLHGQHELAEKFLTKYKIALKHQKKQHEDEKIWTGTASYKHEPMEPKKKSKWWKF